MEGSIASVLQMMIFITLKHLKNLLERLIYFVKDLDCGYPGWGVTKKAHKGAFWQPGDDSVSLSGVHEYLHLIKIIQLLLDIVTFFTFIYVY